MSPGVVNSFVSKRPQCCRTWAQSSCRAQLRRGTAVHKAKFARRLQLKIGLCRLSPTILPTFVMQIKSPLEFKSHFICCRRPWLLDEIPRAIGTCAMLCGPIAHVRPHAARLVGDCAERVSNEISSNSALSTLQGFVQRRRTLVSANVRVRIQDQATVSWRMHVRWKWSPSNAGSLRCGTGIGPWGPE